MKNNPDYRKSFADQKRDSSSGVKKSDLNYYDYYDEDDYSYYNYDADSNNDNEEKIESGGARRPTPTNYLDLKSGNRKKYQNLTKKPFYQKKRYSPNNKQNYQKRPVKYNQYSYDSYEDDVTEKNANRYLHHSVKKVNPSHHHHQQQQEHHQYQPESDYKDQSYVLLQDEYDDEEDFSFPTDFSSPFNSFQVQSHDDSSEEITTDVNTVNDDHTRYKNGVRLGFHQNDPYDDNYKKSEKQQQQVYKRPYQESFSYQDQYEPRPQQQQKHQPQQLQLLQYYQQQQQQLPLQPVIQNNFNFPNHVRPQRQVNNNKYVQQKRSFFPKTNERQPLVDVNGYGPSFTTSFFDSLDLHSGFFDHNFPGSPDAEDYKLNLVKKNPQFQHHKNQKAGTRLHSLFDL